MECRWRQSIHGQERSWIEDGGRLDLEMYVNLIDVTNERIRRSSEEQDAKILNLFRGSLPPSL